MFFLEQSFVTDIPRSPFQILLPQFSQIYFYIYLSYTSIGSISFGHIHMLYWNYITESLTYPWKRTVFLEPFKVK